MNDRQDLSTIEDSCPKWANDLILQLRLLEERLGNLKGSEQWRKADLEELLERVSQDVHLDDGATDQIFSRIVNGLREEGFADGKVAAMINARIPCPGNLTYCNAEEVSSI